MWIILAATVFAAGAGACRADDVKDVKELPASSAVVDDKEAVKLADSLLPAAVKEEAKPAAAAPAETPVASTCVPCCQTCTPCCRKSKFGRGPKCPKCDTCPKCHEGLCHQLKEWLCYRPLQRPGIWGCCHKCEGCRVPPLYYYFLDRCDGGGCSGCALPAAPSSCCSGGTCRAHP
jgi:hypothetical protein